MIFVPWVLNRSQDREQLRALVSTETEMLEKIDYAIAAKASCPLCCFAHLLTLWRPFFFIFFIFNSLGHAVRIQNLNSQEYALVPDLKVHSGVDWTHPEPWPTSSIVPLQSQQSTDAAACWPRCFNGKSIKAWGMYSVLSLFLSLSTPSLAVHLSYTMVITTSRLAAIALVLCSVLSAVSASPISIEHAAATPDDYSAENNHNVKVRLANWPASVSISPFHSPWTLLFIQ